MKPVYSHLVPIDLNIHDPKFPAKCMALTERMRFEMDAIVIQTKTTIADSRTLILQTDRLLLRR